MVIVYLQDLYLVIIYVAVVGPSLLLVGETKSRILSLKKGSRALVYLPLTVLPLLAFAIFAVNFLSSIPFLNASWLGYNIAIGPFGNQGLFGIYHSCHYFSIRYFTSTILRSFTLEKM